MLKRLRNCQFHWQLYWKSWHLAYTKTEDEDFGIYDHVLCIGPFQCRWYSSAIEVD